MEKQKVKHMYGLLEKQFKNLFSLAVKKKGVTGELLIQLLESRLDNIVYRLGLAPTRKAARQLVSHKHITINGLIVNIPSYKTSVGDIVGVRERSASIEIIKEKASTSFTKHAWLEWDKNVMKGKILFQPSRAEIPENIKEQSIVELYSK